MPNGTSQEPIEVCVLKLSSLPHGARQPLCTPLARIQLLEAERRIIEQLTTDLSVGVTNTIWVNDPFDTNPMMVDAVVVIDDLFFEDGRTSRPYTIGNYQWAINLLRSAEQFSGPIAFIIPFDEPMAINVYRDPYTGLVLLGRWLRTSHNVLGQLNALLHRDSESAA